MYAPFSDLILMLTCCVLGASLRQKLKSLQSVGWPSWREDHRRPPIASPWFFTSLFPVTWDQCIEERTQVLEEDGHRLSSWLEMPHPVKLDDLGQFTPPQCLTGDTVQMSSHCSLVATCKWKLSSLVNAWISFLFLCKVVGWSLLSPQRQLLLLSSPSLSHKLQPVPPAVHKGPGSGPSPYRGSVSWTKEPG